MTHEEATLLVPDLVMNRLAPEEEDKVRTHVSGCAECTGTADAYRTIAAAMRFEAEHPLPADLVSHVMGETSRPEVATHLASCPSCSQQAAAVRAAEQQFASTRIPVRRWGALAAAAALALALVHVGWVHLRVLPGMRRTIAEAGEPGSAFPSIAALPLLASATRSDEGPVAVSIRADQRSVFLAVAPALPAELPDGEPLRLEVRESGVGTVRFTRETTAGEIRELSGKSGAFVLVLPASALPDGEARLHLHAASRGDLLVAPFLVERE